MQQILILGAENFIGKRVAAMLPPFASSVRRRVDPADPASIATALEGVGAVVNCQTGAPSSIIANTRALFTALDRSGATPLVVHVSSMTVYGSAIGDVDEASALPDDLGPYARAHADAEALAAVYARSVILRPGCEYGSGCDAWSGRIARLLQAHRIGDLGAGGDGVCNLLHLDDLAHAVLLSLKSPQAVGRFYNLAMSDPPTWNEYFIAYARALDAVPVRRMPAHQLALESKVLAAPLKVLEILARAVGRGRWSTPDPIPPSLLRLARQEIRLVTTRARTELGWTSIPLHAGLVEATKR
jgi:nucleoside-diphosphate-sugar epimerase